MENECSGELCAEVAAIAFAIKIIQWSKMSSLSAMVVLIYDNLITFDDEITLMWTGKLYLGKVIFFTLRYICLAAAIYGNVVLLLPEVSLELCVAWIRFHWVYGTVLAALAEITLQLRLYALYNRSRKILVLLITSFFVTYASMIGICVKVMLNEDAIVLKFGSGVDMHICTPRNLPVIFKAFWIPVLLHESLLCCLAVYKGIESFKEDGAKTSLNSLSLFLVRDSVLYFSVVLFPILANEFVWAIAGVNYIVIPVGFVIATGTIMSQRLLLNVRQQYVQKDMPSTSLSTFRGLHINDSESEATADSHCVRGDIELATFQSGIPPKAFS